MAQKQFGSGEMAFGDGMDGPHEAGYLVLDSARAKADLGYRPRWGLSETVARTMQWYKALDAGRTARELCLGDIRDFTTGELAAPSTRIFAKAG